MEFISSIELDGATIANFWRPIHLLSDEYLCARANFIHQSHSMELTVCEQTFQISRWSRTNAAQLIKLKIFRIHSSVWIDFYRTFPKAELYGSVTMSQWIPMPEIYINKPLARTDIDSCGDNTKHTRELARFEIQTLFLFTYFVRTSLGFEATTNSTKLVWSEKSSMHFFRFTNFRLILWNSQNISTTHNQNVP